MDGLKLWENKPQSIPAQCKTSKGVYIFLDVWIDHVLQASVCLITCLGRAWVSPTLAWLHCARVCVSMLACLDRPLTENFKWVRILILRRSSSWLLPECSIGYLELRRLKLKHTWQLIPCLLQITKCRLPTGSTNFNQGFEQLLQDGKGQA